MLTEHTFREIDMKENTPLQSRARSVHYAELDAIRGLAALGIVLYHFTTRYSQLGYSHVDSPLSFALGQYFVECFFILSGFSISLSLSLDRRPYRFLVRRFARLFPVYWVCIVTIYAVLALWPLENRSVSFGAFLVNLTMMQGILKMGYVDVAHWVLPILVIFYAAIALVYAAKLDRHLLPICLIFVSMQIAYWLMHSRYGFDIPGENFLLLTHGHLLILGVSFYYIKEGKQLSLWHFVPFLCILAHMFVANKTSIMVVCGFTVLLYGFSRGWLQFMAIRPLLFLGSISYSLYLIHQNIGYVMLSRMMAFGVSPLTTLISVVVVMIFVAALLRYYVEIPGNRFVRSLLLK